MVRNAVARINSFAMFTFQIQIFGTVDNLSDHLSVHFQAVSVTVVPGDDDVVPLVVIQGAVTVAFDHVGTVSKVKYVVDVPRRENHHPMTRDSLKPFNGNVWIMTSGSSNSPHSTGITQD